MNASARLYNLNGVALLLEDLQYLPVTCPDTEKYNLYI